MKLRTLITCSLTLTCLLTAWSGSAAAAGPVLPLGHAGRFVTDAHGRVVILHGLNMVYKKPPYEPATPGFGADDAAFLHNAGLNVVRVGVIWKALEPMPGVYDDAYLASIAATVNTLGRRGVVSLIDFHQDLLNEKFGGEGFPDWAIVDDGLPAQPLSGFPLSYVTSPGLNQAFHNFYANAAGPGGVGLQDRFAAAWKHVAELFAHNRYVLGYDIFNEPWPGATNVANCYTGPGCPGPEQNLLMPMESRVMRAIRQADTTHLLWYEPMVTTQAGLSKYTMPNPTGDKRAGMSFHIYCLPIPGHTCSGDEQASLDQAVARGLLNGDALLETEWGASSDLGLIDRQVARDDRSLMSWIYWAYCGCSDPTTAGPGPAQAVVLDPSEPPSGSNVETAKLAHLEEPYPQVIAGTPSAFAFDRAGSSFTLRYATTRAGGSRRFAAGSETDVYVPKVLYPGGYAGTVRGAAVRSKRGAQVLRLASCRGARTVTVTLGRASTHARRVKGARCRTGPARHRRRGRH